MALSRWKSFGVRHAPRNPIERMALETVGRTRIYRTTGKVRARTRWGARRLIRKLFKHVLIEIVSIEEAKP